jgi:hypothetical protein
MLHTISARRVSGLPIHQGNWSAGSVSVPNNNNTGQHLQETMDNQPPDSNQQEQQQQQQGGSKKKKKEKFKEPKIKWKKSKARKLLYKDLMDAAIPRQAVDEHGRSTMRLEEIFQMHPEYKLYDRGLPIKETYKKIFAMRHEAFYFKNWVYRTP